MNTESITPLLEAFRKALVDDITQSLIERLPALKSFEEERLLSPEQVCKLFTPKISKSTLHEWNKKGIVHGKKYGNSVRYKMSEILQAGSSHTKHQRAI